GGPRGSGAPARRTPPPRGRVAPPFLMAAGELALPRRPRGEAALRGVLPLAEALAGPPGEDEQQVAQPVDVAQRPLADRLLTGEDQHAPLGPATHRARLVQEPADPAPARQDEGLERLEVLLAPVHQALQRGDLALADPEHALVRRVGGRGQLAAEVEQLVLDPPEDLVEPPVGLAGAELLGVEHAGQPDDGVELVERAVGLDARGVLGDAAAAHQGGLALVAGPGVDAGDADGHGRPQANTARRPPVARPTTC